MGRKSKRMALYEAIRQGQAKIAQGLESGQMRSDGQSQQNAQEVKDSRQRLVAKSALFESQESPKSFSVSPAMIKILLAGGGIVVLLLVLWLGSLIFSGGGEITEPTGSGQQTARTGREIPLESPGQTPQTAEPAESPKEPEPEKKPGLFNFGKKDEKKAEQPEKSVKPAEPVYASTIGKNVIVIQSIAESRKEILEPLKEFFNSKGIPTEIINNSGDALLITRQGFDKNPTNPGTDGYRLLQKIKQQGLLYPQETGDTKWGVRPFQEAWGLKRKK
ncbi:MAG: hypothetical protein ACYTER_00635 [Planctomycetota bacterium]|jgi:hypothetical protein